jgi:hypothetical protein
VAQFQFNWRFKNIFGGMRFQDGGYSSHIEYLITPRILEFFVNKTTFCIFPAWAKCLATQRDKTSFQTAICGEATWEGFAIWEVYGRYRKWLRAMLITLGNRTKIWDGEMSNEINFIVNRARLLLIVQFLETNTHIR